LDGVNGDEPVVPMALIDFFAARRGGGMHAVYIEQNEYIRVETVAQIRCERPWSLR